MIRRRRLVVVCLVLVIVPVWLALVSAGVSLATASTFTARSWRGISHLNSEVCDVAPPGRVGCLAIRRSTLKANGLKLTNAVSSDGYGPSDIRSAYNLTGSSTATVAIVDAYDDPTAESDLAVYRSRYGLPRCSSANHCFTKVNQTGSTSYPRKDGGWAEEISLDVDMVSATCPGCHILLVEARSNAFTDLAAAVKYAGSVPGVVAISNSYGGGDSTREPCLRPARYRHYRFHR